MRTRSGKGQLSQKPLPEFQPNSTLPQPPDQEASVDVFPRPSSQHDLSHQLHLPSSTSSVQHPDYVLGLADSNRTKPNGPNISSLRPADSRGGSKRSQKHPETFQCSLCLKKFSRLYNLRSHLKRHKDERPFVCSVCGKTFAEQHDRERHEGLHLGERKFVCRGVLKNGNGWGCGRRFARADALGRHFRSEYGKVCIRPLLEEEAAEVPSTATQQGGQVMQLSPPSKHPQAPSTEDPFNPFAQQNPSPHPNYPLPPALLQQYPALAGTQWEALSESANDDVVEDDSIADEAADATNAWNFGNSEKANFEFKFSSNPAGEGEKEEVSEKGGSSSVYDWGYY